MSLKLHGLLAVCDKVNPYSRSRIGLYKRNDEVTFPMKTAVRAIALTIALTGIAAGALTKKSSTGIQVVPADVPMPTCPFQSGDCGISKF
jgi:hypothetical protein